eukprot:gene2185-5201_t
MDEAEVNRNFIWARSLLINSFRRLITPIKWFLITISWPLYFDYGQYDVQLPTTHVFFSHLQQDMLQPDQDLNHKIFKLLDCPCESNIVAHDTISAEDYDFTIELELPNTDVNAKIGMFMVSLWLSPSKKSALSANSGTIPPGLLTTTGEIANVAAGIGSSRPVMLPYRPNIVHMARRVILIIPYLLGIIEDSSVVTVPIIENVRVPPPGLHWGTISLSHSKVQITRATLIATTRMRGLSSFVLGPLLLAALGTMFIIAAIIGYNQRLLQQIISEVTGFEFVRHEEAEQGEYEGLVFDQTLGMHVFPIEEMSTVEQSNGTSDPEAVMMSSPQTQHEESEERTNNNGHFSSNIDNTYTDQDDTQDLTQLSEFENSTLVDNDSANDNCNGSTESLSDSFELISNDMSSQQDDYNTSSTAVNMSFDSASDSELRRRLLGRQD